MRWEIIVMALLLIPAATALGVMPAETELVFKPSTQDEFKLVILNDGRENLVTIEAKNGLANYFDVNPVKLKFEEGETEKFVNIKINYPEKLASGEHITELLVKESPSKGMIGAAIALKAKVKVFSQYQGKFVRIKLPLKRFQVDKPDNFIVEAQSLGLTDVENARAIIDMHDKEKLIVSLTSKSQPIKAGETKFFLLPWTPDIKPGNYKVTGHVEYDGELASDFRFFEVGMQGIELRDIRVENFLKNERVIFSIDLYNNWNAVLGNVRVELEFVKDGLSMATANTEITSLQSYQQKTLTAYWFISDMELGSYNMIVRVRQGSEVDEYQYPAELSKNSLVIEGFEQEEESSYSIFLILVTVLASLLIGREILRHFSSKK